MFRYMERARRFDDELEEMLTVPRETAGEKAAAKEAEPVLERIKKPSALDEVKAIIESAKHGSEEAIREHRVRRQLAEIKTAGQRRVESFLKHCKE